MKSRSYPVTTEVSLPQPHVDIVTKPRNRMSRSGWPFCVTAGIIAVVFMVCVFTFGSETLLMVSIDSPVLVPINKQGDLRVYPFPSPVENGIQSSYYSQLPPSNLTDIVNSLDELLQGYPAVHETPYRNCWLENPSGENPCFFDASWLTDICTPNNSYGYEEANGLFNPCFVLQPEETMDWKPAYTQGIPASISDQFDPGFLPVLCFIEQSIQRGNSSMSITVYPPKGFSHLFFPLSKFDPVTYLAPMVAVKINGIQRGETVSVKCSLITPNSFYLWNNGKAVITFAS